MEVLSTYCNRHGWEKAVVDAATSLYVLREWSKERWTALTQGYDYRTQPVFFPGGKG